MPGFRASMLSPRWLGGGELTSIDFPGAIETAVGRFSDNGGINPRGDIVSDYCDAAPCPAQPGDVTGNVHGFLLSRGGQEEQDSEFTPFDFPGTLGTAAFGINARGDIVGPYVDTSGNVHGYLRSREERDEDQR